MSSPLEPQMPPDVTKMATPDFRFVFESVPVLILVLDPGFRIVAVSDAYLRATMTVREEILGRGVFEVFPDNPDDPGATGVRNLRTSLETVLRTRRADTMAVQKYDIRRPAAEGGGFEERFWSPHNSPSLNAAGEVAYVVHRVEDVTEFVRLKQATREQERATEALRIHAEHVDAEIFQRAQELAEANRQLRTANEVLERLYGEISALMSPEGAEAGDAAEALTPQQMLARVESLIERHQRLEEDLRQAQKMEAVGQLAGGIAHDFNNLLTVIIGYCKLLMTKVPAGDSTHRKLQHIASAGEQAAALTQQLLAFGRKQVLEPRVMNLASTLDEMERMLRRLVPANIELITVIDPDLADVRVDPRQMQQVILNLVVNSRDAMPDGGRITLELRNLHLDPVLALSQNIPAGRYVALTVTDTGIGIDPVIQTRVFEPFFTTKEPGRGTGLGLATVYGIVKQSGGYLWLNSEPGQGAAFHIFLPQSSELAAPAPVRRSEGMVRGQETLLIVEDDDALRALASETLSSAGYRVLAARDGEEGARLFAENEPIQLLLADVVLSKGTGADLARQLTSIRPQLKVVFMSGYALERGLPFADAAIIAKPFSPEALCSKIRAVLDTLPVKSILVVDDDPAIREFLREALETAGFAVTTAENGRQARKEAAKRSFDLVITDLLMPEEDGVETIQRLREGRPDLKIIAISGDLTGPWLKAARLLGANATLTKPVTQETILNCIRQVLAK